MLTNEQLIRVDTILRSCGTTSLSTQEENWLSDVGTVINEDCDFFKVAQSVILDREKHKMVDLGTMNKIIELAAVNGCVLDRKEPVKPEPVIPLFGGGISHR